MSGNGDYGALREDVMSRMRQQVRGLAFEGFSEGEIASRLEPGLTATESELLLRATRFEVSSVRRGRVADSLRGDQRRPL